MKIDQLEDKSYEMWSQEELRRQKLTLSLTSQQNLEYRTIYKQICQYESKASVYEWLDKYMIYNPVFVGT